MSNLLPLATLVRARQKPVAALISGKDVPLEVLAQIPGPGIGRERTLLMYSQYTQKAGSTIEDLFTPEFYSRCVRDVYSNIALSAVPTSRPTERGEEHGIIHTAEEAVDRRQGERFERWKVAEILSDRICEAPGVIEEETVERFVRLFSEINLATGDSEVSAKV
jgi:hypothetical protein